jgi:hypothetical protein
MGDGKHEGWKARLLKPLRLGYLTAKSPCLAKDARHGAPGWLLRVVLQLCQGLLAVAVVVDIAGALESDSVLWE